MLDKYDFNETFGVLKVYDQGATDDCFYYTRALIAAAKIRMHENRDFVWSGKPGGDWVMEPGQNYTWEVRAGGETHRVDESDTAVNPDDHEAVKEAFLKSGVLLVDIQLPESIKLFDQTSMPVIVPKSADQFVSAHSLAGVGFDPRGPIVQSSWGLRWGFQGRAILSWAWWDAFVLNVRQPRVDQWPIDDMPDPLPVKPAPAPEPTPPAPAPSPTPTPVPVKENKLLLVRKSSSNTVYAVHGGVKSWIQDRRVLVRQGVTMDDVKVIPDNDIIFTNKVPLVGPTPRVP